MLDFVLLTAIGVLIGALTGSIPGLHPNTIVFSSFPLYFSSGIGLSSYIAFVAGLSVSHTFHDFLPAIYLSAPSSESAVASVPGAEMAKNGEGKQAFRYTVTGGMIAVGITVLISPLLFVVLKPVYSVATELMHLILGFFLIFIILDNWRPSALLITFLSGVLGILAFRMPVNQNFILMPVFSGLFALPAIFEAYKTDFEISEQNDAENDISLKGGSIGFFSGLLAGTVPGVGAGAATSFLSPLIKKQKQILTGLGAVNTSDIFISLIVLFLLEKGRSGASVAIQTLGTLNPQLFAVALGCSLFAVGLSLLLVFKTEKLFLKSIRSFKLKRVLLSVVIVIFVLTFVFTGVFGLLALATSCCIGFLAWFKDCRTCGMAVLIVPALLFYLGIGIFI